MAKPENVMIAHIHKNFHPEVYKMKTHNAYLGGPWDTYYETYGEVLWVEYKYTEKLPRITDLCDLSKKTCLSKLQQDWGERLHRNAINNAVILGWGIRQDRKFMVFDNMTWTKKYSKEELEEHAYDTEQLLKWFDTQLLS